ncbi:saccharopine dehydrogenase NADP-binding domain-containing protein [Luteococcus sp.]|uniref:saccharopine dehydrogenase NADP-binding domain-containing protein n=1 Tax=Luteococcus sp. TaxID=1969402 RepID=UPI003736F037
MHLPAPEIPFTGWQPMSTDEVLRVLSARAVEGRPRIVAVDGRGAAGKTTLASDLAERVPGAVVVHTDDLAWHEPLFGWAHLEHQLLTAARAGQEVHLVPPQWTARGREGSIDVPAGSPLVVVEGTGAAQRAVADLLDAVVWVQSDFEEAERRGIERDIAQGVNGDADETTAFWHAWMAHELDFFAEDRPWERADLVVAGSPVEAAELLLADDERAVVVTPRTDGPAMPDRPQHGREFDVVVHGATGYVGRLIAAELVRSAPRGTRIALAGRNLDRLRVVAQELGHADLPLLVADSFDADALAAMARRTAVVIAVAGPYVKYGMALAGACAGAGTHYVDLNGEVLFARDVADSFDQAARASRATLVNSCGFDSIPSDLGVMLAAEVASERGEQLLGTTMHLRELSGAMSGGTIDALRTQIDASRHGVRTPGRSSSDPYALSPDRASEPQPLRHRNNLVWLESSAEVKEFSAPFFMARYNEQLVRRSNALMGWRYGRAFRYREVHDTGRGLKGLVRGIGIAAALPAFVAALATPGLRQVADRVLPAPGQGPSPEQRARGHFSIEVHAETTGGARIVTTVSDRRDPGYEGTAVMISQAALALAAGEALRAGVATPASALGTALVERLRVQGFTLQARVTTAS